MIPSGIVITEAARSEGGYLVNGEGKRFMDKYDSSEVLFYLDPPYPGKEWYNFNFSDNDFRELKSLIDRVVAHYILNVDDNIPMITRIFGSPTFLRSYPNNNSKNGSRPEESKKKAFYMNFRDPVLSGKAGKRGSGGNYQT